MRGQDNEEEEVEEEEEKHQHAKTCGLLQKVEVRESGNS